MSAAGDRHISVLGREAVDLLSPHDGGIYVDATFGAGGYSRMILDVAGTRVIGIDRDPAALAAARARLGDRATLVHGELGDIRRILADLGIAKVDGFLADLGVSSPQLDEAERGFSFMREGPLDMRMGDGPTLADYLAQVSEQELARVIRTYGEERFAGRVAHAIVANKRHLLDEARPSPALGVARSARGADIQRPETVDGAKRNAEELVAVIEARDILCGQAVDRDVARVDERARRIGRRIVAVARAAALRERRDDKRGVGDDSGQSVGRARHDRE